MKKSTPNSKAKAYDTMLFIDWISEPNHKNFNRAFFTALRLKNAECLVFSKNLVIDEISCKLEEKKKSRLAQAFRIFQIIWHHRNSAIVLLTYDPIFVPLVRLTNRRVVLFEHNTTPLKGWSKHFIWQKLFFGRLMRMAQFPAQYKRLAEFGAHVTYIGSPLIDDRERVRSKHVAKFPFVFLVPSYRAELSDIDKLSQIFNGSKIIAKKGLKLNSYHSNSSGYEIETVDRLEFHHNDRHIDAVVITVQSRLRGTGWFNDAISNSIPILVTNRNARALLEETFPNYPFIDAERIKGLKDLGDSLVRLSDFNTVDYIEEHNRQLRRKFLAMCESLGLEIKPVSTIGES